jgi:hypothetical protein
MSQPEVTEIELPICHSESSRPATEVIEAIRLCPHQFKLLYSPGMVEGVAKGDVIELSNTDPKGFIVVSRAGCLCLVLLQETGSKSRP